jgi:hypothetical protein
VLVQEDRRMSLAGQDLPDTSDRQVPLSAFGRHSHEKTPDPRTWAPRMLIYPMEIANIMGLVKIGRYRTLHTELVEIGTEIAALCVAWAGTPISGSTAIIKHSRLTVLSHSGLYLPGMQPCAFTRTSWKTDRISLKYPAHTRMKEAKFLKGCTPIAAHH